MNANRTQATCAFGIVCAVGSLQWPGLDAGIVLLVVGVVATALAFIVGGAD